MIIILLFILSLILNIALIFGVNNLLRKLSVYEEYIPQVQVAIQRSIESMRSIDLRGAFEAEDEVGIVFKGLLGIVTSLEEFTAQGENED